MRLTEKVEYIPDAPIDFEIEGKLASQDLPTRFDLIVIAGVIYHTYDSLVNIMAARHLAKNESLVIVDAARR